MTRAVIAFALLLWAAPAFAEPGRFHQTYSVHPLLPFAGQYEISGEWRTADKVGVMASPLFMHFTVDSYEVTGFTLTAQGRYYVLGTFSTGLFLGGMGGGGFASVQGTVDDDDASATSGIIQVGPVLGGKLAFPVGLTFDVDIGVLLGEAVASATVGDTTAPQTSSFQAIPLVELRAGWSF